MHRTIDVQYGGKLMGQTMPVEHKKVSKLNIFVDDMTDEDLEDLKFAIRTEQAYRRYQKGEFKTVTCKEFLELLD